MACPIENPLFTIGESTPLQAPRQKRGRSVRSMYVYPVISGDAHESHCFLNKCKKKR